MALAYVSLFCRALVGLVFAASALSKLQPGGFRHLVSWVSQMPVPLASALREPLAVGIVVTEATVVVMIGVPAFAAVGLILAAILLAGFLGVTSLLLYRGFGLPCPCFGSSKTRLGKHHIFRDLVLLAAALVSARGIQEPTPVSPTLAVVLLGAAIGAVLLVAWDDIAFLLHEPQTT